MSIKGWRYVPYEDYIRKHMDAPRRKNIADRLKKMWEPKVMPWEVPVPERKPRARKAKPKGPQLEL